MLKILLVHWVLFFYKLRISNNDSYLCKTYMKQQRIRDVAMQEQDTVILNGTKLDLYKNIYKVQARAHYVDLISCISDRSVSAKLRISAETSAWPSG